MRLLYRGEVAYVAKNHMAIDDVALARKVLRLLDGLDDQDDVQEAYSNYQFSDQVTEALAPIEVRVGEEPVGHARLCHASDRR